MRTRTLATPFVDVLMLIVLLVLSGATPALAQRLPATATPEHYDLAFTVDLHHARF